MVDPGDRADARDPATGPHDHLAVDRLADQAVGAADVIGALRGDRRRLDPEAGLRHRGCGLRADIVVSPATALEREVEPLEVHLQADHAGSDHPQRLLEQLLPGLVALEHHYPQPGHLGCEATHV